MTTTKHWSVDVCKAHDQIVGHSTCRCSTHPHAFGASASQRIEVVPADQLARAVMALHGIRVTLEARYLDPDAADVAYDATGHALAALNALGDI
jgi:hypothetical protein